MKRIIILNGPPESGKDLLAGYLTEKYPFVKHLKFAAPLKEATHRFYNTTEKHAQAFEHCKDLPNQEFLGLTPRQAYINISEHYIKRFHGDEYFGLMMILQLKKYPYDPNNVFVISDGGFESEVLPITKNFNPNLLWVVPLERDGKTFNTDSRNYLNKDKFVKLGVTFLPPLVNPDTSKEDYLKRAEEHLLKQDPTLFDEVM